MDFDMSNEFAAMKASLKELEEHPLSSEVIFDGKLLHVRRDEVALPDGSRSTREYILHPGAVVVIPVLEGEKIIMERQYRYAPRQVFYELPAGKVDVGEDYLTTGKRELLEETGYEADNWTFLCHIHPAIGYADEKMALYLATGLHLSRPDRDNDEFLQIVELELDTALELLRRDQITDAKTMVGLFWAEKILRRIWEIDQ